MGHIEPKAPMSVGLCLYPVEDHNSCHLVKDTMPKQCYLADTTWQIIKKETNENDEWL